MRGFLDALAEQRWDDHRFYHHSRVNQSLHLLSALSFLCCYGLLFTNRPVAAVMLGWLFAMLTRQAGHFFFEPKGYDEANRVTHEYKEAVKVGYNLRRKRILLALWALAPVAVWLDPTLVGFVAASAGWPGYADALARLWLALGVGAVLFRTVHLFFLKDARTGLVWLTKILTDPFHDVMLYYKSPLHLLRGQWIDPIVGHRAA
jgi:hypothetical protein